jgi:hypothetical protein
MDDDGHYCQSKTCTTAEFIDVGLALAGCCCLGTTQQYDLSLAVQASHAWCAACPWLLWKQLTAEWADTSIRIMPNSEEYHLLDTCVLLQLMLVQHRMV